MEHQYVEYQRTPLTKIKQLGCIEQLLGLKLVTQEQETLASFRACFYIYVDDQ